MRIHGGAGDGAGGRPARIVKRTGGTGIGCTEEGKAHGDGEGSEDQRRDGRFHDDAYARASKEEIERRKRQAQAVCEQIFQNAARRGDRALKEAQ